jgi:hypothetical protein
MIALRGCSTHRHFDPRTQNSVLERTRTSSLTAHLRALIHHNACLPRVKRTGRGGCRSPNPLSMNSAPRVPLSHAQWSSQPPESQLVYPCRVNSETHNPSGHGEQFRAGVPEADATATSFCLRAPDGRFRPARADPCRVRLVCVGGRGRLAGAERKVERPQQPPYGRPGVCLHLRALLRPRWVVGGMRPAARRWTPDRYPGCFDPRSPRP